MCLQLLSTNLRPLSVGCGDWRDSGGNGCSPLSPGWDHGAGSHVCGPPLSASASWGSTWQEGPWVCPLSCPHLLLLLCYHLSGPRDHGIYCSTSPPLPNPGLPLCGRHWRFLHTRHSASTPGKSVLQSTPPPLPTGLTLGMDYNIRHYRGGK